MYYKGLSYIKFMDFHWRISWTFLITNICTASRVIQQNTRRGHVRGFCKFREVVLQYILYFWHYFLSSYIELIDCPGESAEHFIFGLRRLHKVLWLSEEKISFISPQTLWDFRPKTSRKVGGLKTKFCLFTVYSLVCFALFCLVKRIVQYFVKEWSEQKVSVTNVVGLYSTYQKCIIIGAPNSYQFREKLTWVFYQKNLLKSKHFFYEK